MCIISDFFEISENFKFFERSVKRHITPLVQHEYMTLYKYWHGDNTFHIIIYVTFLSHLFWQFKYKTKCHIFLTGNVTIYFTFFDMAMWQCNFFDMIIWQYISQFLTWQCDNVNVFHNLGMAMWQLISHFLTWQLDNSFHIFWHGNVTMS